MAEIESATVKYQDTLKVLQGADHQQWDNGKFCDWLLKMEPIMYDHMQSHVPVNLWKLQPEGQMDLNVIGNNHPELIGMLLDKSVYDFVIKPIRKKNLYQVHYLYIGQINVANKEVPNGVGRAIMDDNTIHEGVF